MGEGTLPVGMGVPVPRKASCFVMLRGAVRLQSPLGASLLGGSIALSVISGENMVGRISISPRVFNP